MLKHIVVGRPRYVKTNVSVAYNEEIDAYSSIYASREHENSLQLDVPGMPGIALVAHLDIFLEHVVRTRNHRVVQTH